ncbi:MAG: signal peptidase I [Bacillota bacterium]
MEGTELPEDTEASEEEKLRPDLPELREELAIVKERQRRRRVIQSTVFALATAVAIAILIFTLWLPVLRIHGNSMTPVLHEGNVVVASKGARFQTGDVIAFYYNNQILVKRVIANPGDWVDIDEEGNVYVNGELLDEPYVEEKSLGKTDIRLPYQVPENRIFVMGDHRSVSIDSRNTSVGCVADEQIVGKLLFRVLPPGGLGGS